MSARATSVCPRRQALAKISSILAASRVGAIVAKYAPLSFLSAPYIMSCWRHSIGDLKDICKDNEVFGQQGKDKCSICGLNAWKISSNQSQGVGHQDQGNGIV